MCLLNPLERLIRQCSLMNLSVTPGFREPWENRGEGARGDRDEPEGGNPETP